MPATPNKWRNHGRSSVSPPVPLNPMILKDLNSNNLFIELPNNKAQFCVWIYIDSMFFCINTKTNYVRKLVYSFDLYDLESYLWQQGHWELAEVGSDVRAHLYHLKGCTEGSIPYESYKVFELGQLKLPEWGSATTGFPAEVNKTFRSAFPKDQFTTVADSMEQLTEMLNDLTS